MWNPSQRPPDPHLSTLIAGCLEFQDELAAHHPHVPFPQNACCFNFNVPALGLTELPLPVGLMLTLWSEQPAWHGRCAHCHEVAVYGFGCGGMLATGGVMGQCIACDKSNFHFLGGLAAVARQLKEMIEPTPYRVAKGRFGGCFEGPKVPLYQLLKQLGCAALPPENWLLERQKPAATLKKSNR